MFSLKTIVAFTFATLFAAVQAAPGNCPPGVTVTVTKTITVTNGGPHPTGKPPGHPTHTSVPAHPTAPTSSHPIPTTKPHKPTTTIATGPVHTPGSQCNTGPIQCCKSVQRADSSSAQSILGLLGVVLKDLTVMVGIQCTSISAVGIGGNSCSAQAVCCENNTYNGLINIGCSPINL